MVEKVNWHDNPWFPSVLEQERLYLQRLDPAGYDNVWEGNPRTFSEGAYFRQEMESLKAAGRIGDVPHNPNKPVYVFFDLSHSSRGKGDPHALWFLQLADGSGFDVIDYWEGNNISLPEVARSVLKARPYTYEKLYLPHDGANSNSHTDQTDKELLEGFGFNVEIQERTKDVDRDVNLIRVVLPMCKFDEVKCKQGLSALRNHRQEKDEKTGLWKFKHDWTSHGTSAFRGFAVEHQLIRPRVNVAITSRRGALSM